MKTSMAYRLFRLYFNDNADNHSLFGNRVHNPLNADLGTSQFSAALIRAVLVVAVIAAIVSITAL